MGDVDDIDVSNVTHWEGRPKRTRRAPPKTYWEEYVETDQWYLRKLVEDVPPEEMHAALDDECLSDAGEDGDSELDEEDEDSDWDDPIAPGVMWPSELSSDETDIPSEDESDATDTDIDTDTDTGPPTVYRETPQVHRTTEG